MEGRTENISRSGILFHSSAPLEVDVPVELSFALPVEAGGESGAMVVCHGQIVRRLLSPASDAPSALAAKILEYHLKRRVGSHA